MEAQSSDEPSATVVSLVPFRIEETKPGMVPDKFVIAPASEGDFSTLLIQKCRHGVYLDSDRPVLVVPTAPEEVAEAIRFDYMKGQMALVLGETEPGLFWVPGNYVSEEGHKILRATFASKFREAERRQINWFKALVGLADDAWTKFRQRGMISYVQKTAASRLKLDREWLLEAEVTAAMSECPVCFDKVNPRALICRTCDNILNPVEYAKHQFAKEKATTPQLAPAPIAR